jgi:hypothetical protein
MKPPVFAALALFASCSLAACGPRDAAFAPSNFAIHGRFAPMDVAVPNTFGTGASEFDGIYSEGSGVLSCCWIAPRATLLVRKSGPARTLVAGLRVPNIPRFEGGQTIAIAFASGQPHVEHLEAGSQYTIKVPVPRAIVDAKGLIPITIASDVDYVPSRDAPPVQSLATFLHLRTPPKNNDVRHLGGMLLYLYFQ